MSLFQTIAVCLIAAVPALSQRNVVVGHIHLNSADPAASMAFWKDVIGTSAFTNQSLNGVSMIGVLILFTKTAPMGPSAGSAIDHIGITVPDLQPFEERLAKTSYKSSKPTEGGDRLLIEGPDGVRVELIEDNSMFADKQFSHIHFHTAQPKDMQAWYAKNFGARPAPGDNADSSLLAGATLTFTQAESAVPTVGRAIDHIGFEVKGLEAFCKALTDGGVKLDSPYHSQPELKLATAFLTDPWGTRIELTEGLSH
jgi:catechol 2,3-dioxygenase-like lactoylglutathione lyase family enzyme